MLKIRTLTRALGILNGFIRLYTAYDKTEVKPKYQTHLAALYFAIQSQLLMVACCVNSSHQLSLISQIGKNRKARMPGYFNKITKNSSDK